MDFIEDRLYTKKFFFNLKGTNIFVPTRIDLNYSKNGENFIYTNLIKKVGF